MSKIKVLVIPSDTFGVGKFRILDPFKYIGDNYSDEIHVDIAFNTEDNHDFFKNYDIVVFHSFIHKLPHEANIARINWLKNQGIKVIMDIDDHWKVDQRHPMYHQILFNKVSEKKVELMRLSDYVTTTTPVFANTIKTKLGIKNVLVFPNAVNDEEQQFQPNKIESEKIRFGWLGGSSHLHDLELLRNGISSVYSAYGEKIQFVLCGFDTRGSVNEINKETNQVTQRPIQPMETVWYKYEQIFTDNYNVLDEEYKNYLMTFTEGNYVDKDKPYVRRWTREVSKYANNYNYFDVSLAPIVDSEFNTNKSQLKVIEAGFHKKALIASEINPYTIDLISGVDDGKFNSKGNALLVSPNRNHKQWTQHMKKLYENPNMIEDLGNRLYETVKDKYSLRKVCKDRVEFIKSIINK
jgi:glycosyltransferase involved in cell wall biosynthesis